MWKAINYRHFFQFQYERNADNTLNWYTEQNRFVGTTTNDFFEVCELLDGYLREYGYIQ